MRLRQIAGFRSFIQGQRFLGGVPVDDGPAPDLVGYLG